MTEATQTTTESSPITAGATNKKAKAQAAKGKTKTAAAKTAPSSNGARSTWPDENVIHVSKTDALKDFAVRGKRRDALDVLKDGMTVEKFRAAMDKKDLKTHIGWALTTATEEKLITVKKPT